MIRIKYYVNQPSSTFAMKTRTPDYSKAFVTAFVTMILAGFFSGCGARVDLDTQGHTQMLQSDRVDLDDQTQKIRLSLLDAVKRGMEKNLDARVAALEALSQQRSVSVTALRALPTVAASAEYTNRSNEGASSSRSVATGLESLEASQSVDRQRRLGALKLDWNLIDAAIALSDTAKARDDEKIAQERLQKVIQNVERDVYGAYWRALAYQNTANAAQAAMREAQMQIGQIEVARKKHLLGDELAASKTLELLERVQSYGELVDRSQLAQVELKSLLSYPAATQLVLTTKEPGSLSNLRKLVKGDIKSLEWLALRQRPEMREEILKRNITIEDTRREILQTFPGLNIALSRQYDSNNFLVDNVWNTLSLSIVQSVTNLLTLPARYQASKSRQYVADARRQALNAAIVAQIHIGRQRLLATQSAYQYLYRAAESANRKARSLQLRRINGLASGEDIVSSGLEAKRADLRAGLAYAEYLEAYAAMKNALGCGVLSEVMSQISNGCEL